MSVSTVGGAALSTIHEDRIVDLTCRLINEPSPTGSELACAELLARHFESHGLQAEVQRFGERRANVIARLPGSGVGPRLLFCGHLDTTESEEAPRAEVRDGMITGLGAFNQKGGLAAAAEAVLALAASGEHLAGDVAFAAVAGETGKAPVRGTQRDYLGPSFEGGGIGARWLLDHAEPQDAVVVTGPSDCQVVNAQTGYLSIKLTILGRAVYQASKPGVSASTGIELASRVVLALSKWEPDYRARHTLDCGLGTLYPNVTVGAIDAGSPYRPSLAPGLCNLYVDLRVAPGQNPDDALHELEAVVSAALSGQGRFDLEVYQHHAPGALTPLDHPLVQAAMSAQAKVLGQVQTRVDDEQLAISNDGGIFAARGIPFVKCGPGGLVRDGPRIDVEQVSIAQLVQSAQIYVRLAVDLSSRDRHDVAAQRGFR